MGKLRVVKSSLLQTDVGMQVEQTVKNCAEF